MTTRTVTGRWLQPDRTTPATGKIRFIQVDRVTISGSYMVLPNPPIDATLDDTGSISVSLPVTGVGEPDGWMWQAVEQIGDGSLRYFFELPAAAGALDLSTIAPRTDASPGPFQVGPKGDKGDTGDTGVVAATAPATYNSATRTIGIAAGGVGTSQLADAAVTGPKIAANSIDSSHIQPGVVIESDVADGAVTSAKIADDAVTAAKIAANAVGSSELADASVDTAALQDSSVTNAKLAGSIDPAKVTGTAVVTSDARLSDTRTPSDGSVTDAKIATTLSPSKITGTAVVTSDARLSDARTPTAHKTSHATGGTDALSPADIGAATASQGSLADGAAQKASNLSDLANTATALSNIGGTPTSRTITAGTGLTGGGDLSANRTVSITAGGVGTTELAASSVTDAKVATGIAASKISGTALVASNNLSDVTTAATALANLGGAAAFQVTKSGRWVTGCYGNMNSTALTANLCIGILYPVTVAHTLDRIGMRLNVAGSTGSVIRLGIYKAAANGADYTLVLDAGTIDGTQSAGEYSITISQALTPGLYCFVLACQGNPSPTNPTIQTASTANTPAYLISADSHANATTNQNPFGLSFGTMSGALSASVTPTRHYQTPVIAGRIA